MYVPRLCLWIHKQHNTLKNNGLLCRRSSYQPNISDCTHAVLLSSHYPPFVFVRGQMLKPGKALSCRCITSMQDLSGQTSLQKSQINTDSNIHWKHNCCLLCIMKTSHSRLRTQSNEGMCVKQIVSSTENIIVDCYVLWKPVTVGLGLNLMRECVL